MPRSLTRTARLALALMIFADVAGAASVRALTLDALIQKSDYVVYGRTAASRSFLDPATRTIWTETELVVLEGAKGRPGRTIPITEPGGVLGNIVQLFPGVPRFEPHKEVVLFLFNAPGNRIRVLGLQQGILGVFQDPESGEKMVRPAVEYPETIAVSGPLALKAQLGWQTSRRLNQFLNLIRQSGSVR